MNDNEWTKQCLKYWSARIESIINSINYKNMTYEEFNTAVYDLSGAFEYIWNVKSKLEGGNNNCA